MMSFRASTSLLRQSIQGGAVGRATRQAVFASSSSLRPSQCAACSLQRQLPAWQPLAAAYSTAATAAESTTSSAAGAAASAGASGSAAPAESDIFFPGEGEDSGDLPTSDESAYVVERCGPAGTSLPVYTEYKNNRSRTYTIVRRVTGDVFALKDDLEATLPSLVEAASKPSRKYRDLKPYKPRSGRAMPTYPLIRAIPGTPDVATLPGKGIVPSGGRIVLEGKKKREVEEWLLHRGF